MSERPEKYAKYDEIVEASTLGDHHGNNSIVENLLKNTKFGWGPRAGQLMDACSLRIHQFPLPAYPKPKTALQRALSRLKLWFPRPIGEVPLGYFTDRPCPFRAFRETLNAFHDNLRASLKELKDRPPSPDLPPAQT